MTTRLMKASCILLAAALVFAGACIPAAGTLASAAAGSRKGPIVIIDAGHGGADGGAVSPSGLRESAINLEVANKLELILAFFGTEVVMTRREEALQYSDKANTIHAKKVEDTKRRIDLVNAVPGAVLISIHQNTFPAGGPFGTQVLYAPTEGSQALAEYMQQLFIREVNPENRRAASKIPKSVMLMNHVTCPAVLIECGFLSNAQEEKLLHTGGYQLKLAAVIAAGYHCNKDSLTNPASKGSSFYEVKNSILLYRMRQ